MGRNTGASTGEQARFEVRYAPTGGIGLSTGPPCPFQFDYATVAGVSGVSLPLLGRTRGGQECQVRERCEKGQRAWCSPKGDLGQVTGWVRGALLGRPMAVEGSMRNGWLTWAPR